MENKSRKLNPEYQFIPQGYNLKWIKNPNYPENSIEEEIQIARWDNEFVEVWYWLVYQGKDPEGFAEPSRKNIKKDKERVWKYYRYYPEGSRYGYNWKPENNCWREATDKEILEIKKELKSVKARRLREVSKKVATLEGQKLSGEVEIPISYIYKLSSGKIVKRWRHHGEI